MPYKRKDSPVWWASFTDPGGKRVRQSTGTTDRREAEALEAKWKLEAYRARQWDEKPDRTFDELMLAYLKATRMKRSHRRDLVSAKVLYRHFTGRGLRGLSASDIRGYIGRRQAEGVAPATINRELALLSGALNHARREWDWDIPNPAAGRKLKEPEGRVRWLTRAEAQALIRAAEGIRQAQHLADFIRLALATGCRSGELLGLDWRRVDFHAGLIHLDGSHTKSGKRRSIPVNTDARGALLGRARHRAEHCPASPWVFADSKGERIASVKKSFATACKAAKVEDFRIHDLRHTCAAWLVSAGVPLPEVRDLLGHSTVKMTERYAHLAPENVRQAVAKIEGLSRFGHADKKEADLKVG